MPDLPEPPQSDWRTFHEGKEFEYVGETNIADEPHGNGVWRFSTGSSYEGEWENGKRHGYGICKFTTGGYYKGEFKDDLRHGSGYHQSSSGWSYKGSWKDDKRDGHGVMEYPNGDRYEGGWKDSERNGHGVLEFPNGGSYEGGWKGDEKHGFGKLTQHNSWKDRPKGFHLISYEGGMKDNNAHGMGVRFVWDGDVGKFYREEGFFEISEDGFRIRECRTTQVEPKTIRKAPGELDVLEWIEVPVAVIDSGAASYAPSKSWSGPEVESRGCEEKWDNRCSGRANVIKVGKWMCYHCRDEYEDHWDHDDAGG
jgi:hypothetical protein